MSARKRNFGDALEPVIYWDTSFVIAFREATASFHAECDAFRVRLVSEQILPVVSEFVYDELAFVLIRDALMTEARRRRVGWQTLRRRAPHLLRAAMPSIDAARRDLEAQTIDLLITPAVRARAFQLMHDFNLLPTDAYHIAAALEAGVDAFASLDADFLNADGIIVYTCLP